MTSLESDEEEPKQFEQEAEFQPVPLELPLSQVAEPSLIGIESVTIDAVTSQRPTDRRPAGKKIVGILKKPQSASSKPSYDRDERTGENGFVKAAPQTHKLDVSPQQQQPPFEPKSAASKAGSEKKGIKWLKHVLEPDAFQLLQQHENEMNELKGQLKILLDRQHKVDDSSLTRNTATSPPETRDQSTQTEPVETYEQGLILPSF